MQYKEKLRRKEFKCCICHKTLDKKPIRLVHQENDNKEVYDRYYNVNNYDFCDKHFETFIKWVEKHR